MLVGLPAPNAPLPRRPAALVQALKRDDAALNVAIDRWDPSRRPPLRVTLLALYDQRVLRLLVDDRRLAAAVLRREPGLRDDVAALRDLRALSAPGHGTYHAKTGAPAPATRLRAWYREAAGRFHVRWQLLAAVNFVESAFGKIRNASSAGAQGPMQFEPATWAAYGLGGNVHDPDDAILGAANYLAASGAARDERGALLHYNPSSLYAAAVLAYARQITRDPHAFLRYYAWQVFVRTATGTRRVTGPGL